MKRPLYLDYAATTPMCLPALEAFYRCLGPKAAFGNPHSNHFYGLEADALVQQASEMLAMLIGAKPEQLLWTSGATEANNLALQGVARFYASRGRHLITLQTEHHAVLDVFQALEAEGFEVTYLPVDKAGRLAPDTLSAALRPDTLLVSLLWVNNEIGVIQDLAALAPLVKTNGSFLHVDAAQALGKISIDLATCPIDLLSLSGHKVHGPKGVGALFVRSSVRLKPLFFGGGQQKNLRPGTVSPALAQAFAYAAKWTCSFLGPEASLRASQDDISRMRNHLWQGLEALGNITPNTDFKHSVPHILNVRFQNMDGEALFTRFKEKLALSQGSACTSTQLEPSHVLKAIGLTHQEADSSFRFSLSPLTTLDEINAALHHIENVVTDLRTHSPLWHTPSTLPSEAKIVEWSDAKRGYAIRVAVTLDPASTHITATTPWTQGPSYLTKAVTWLCEQLTGQALSSLETLDPHALASALTLSPHQRYVIPIIVDLKALMINALAPTTNSPYSEST